MQMIEPSGPNAALVVLCTVPDVERGAAIGHSLVAERLAACVNVVPAVRSIYRWEGKVCDDKEALLVIKTTRERLDALAERISALHPYEVPELLALEVRSGSKPYLSWLVESTRV
jgi:periplasmic divalent cation tolerance protein